MGWVRSYRTFSPLLVDTSFLSFAPPQAAGLSSFHCVSSPHGLDGAERYLSVALVLGSPPAGVTRYPCPVEPGLSSQGAFRPSCAAVRSGRSAILPQENKIVKGFSQQLKTFPKSVILIASYAETRNGP